MKKRMLLLTLLIIPQLNAWAETPEEKGLAIAVEADKQDTGWKDQQSELKMILRNRQGQETQRNIRNRQLEVDNDGDKTLSIFDSPRDVKGTAFLSYTHSKVPDDQWLFLPALKRVKRISSNNKSGPFMGSEFAYEDITSQEVDKYTYKWLNDETYEGNDVFVVERYPSYKHSGYTKQITWIDKKMYQPLKIVFYDRKGAKLKTLTYYDYKQYLNKFWRPDRMEMVNHLTHKSTTLLWSKYKFDNGYTDRDFDRNSLKRAR
ncbi:MAG: outer membrane lipoprotein-sorting protein [Gammaproteobacteria bacterium]|nr:outer membrane lipoprotein-sorting protein [Gammaproteobacteria bacterium]